MTEKTLCIGIDPGTETGFAVWDCEEERYIMLKPVKLHTALSLVKQIRRIGRVYVRVEDARKRTWFGRAGREKLQGAGSIKRDCTIWEDFLTDLQNSGIIEGFDLVAPKNNITKLTSAQFRTITKHKGPTNEHTRDAGMMVFMYKPTTLKAYELQ